MSLIPVRDTAPEQAVKRALWAAGFRYARSKNWKLPGSPDLIFPSLGAVVFVHGCFWHGHLCPLGRTPKSNQAFWVSKISANRARDLRVIRALRALGWRVITIWECSLADGTRRAMRALSSTRNSK
jgi:DNA mismatch endonuclease, patch repair protein